MPAICYSKLSYNCALQLTTATCECYLHYTIATTICPAAMLAVAAYDYNLGEQCVTATCTERVATYITAGCTYYTYSYVCNLLVQLQELDTYCVEDLKHPCSKAQYQPMKCASE